jgi:hypothetical protein
MDAVCISIIVIELRLNKKEYIMRKSSKNVVLPESSVGIPVDIDTSSAIEPGYVKSALGFELQDGDVVTVETLEELAENKGGDEDE